MDSFIPKKRKVDYATNVIDMREPKPIVPKQKYHCAVCDKVFDKPSTLQRHEQSKIHNAKVQDGTNSNEVLDDAFSGGWSPCNSVNDDIGTGMQVDMEMTNSNGNININDDVRTNDDANVSDEDDDNENIHDDIDASDDDDDDDNDNDITIDHYSQLQSMINVLQASDLEVGDLESAVNQLGLGNDSDAGSNNNNSEGSGIENEKPAWNRFTSEFHPFPNLQSLLLLAYVHCCDDMVSRRMLKKQLQMMTLMIALAQHAFKNDLPFQLPTINYLKVSYDKV
jgi:hypothetical protein